MDSTILEDLGNITKSTIEDNKDKFPMQTAEIYHELMSFYDEHCEKTDIVKYTLDDLKNNLQDCVRISLEKYRFDAADVVNDNSGLYWLFKASVTSCDLDDDIDNSPTDYTNHAFDVFLKYFKQNKSSKIDIVKEHFSVASCCPEEFQDDEAERLDDSIRSLFGTNENYNKYLENCFKN